MITLHQFARVWDIPNLSPFCCKLETYLRMTGLPYRVVPAVPPRAPKGKLPYITDEGRTIADSRFVIEYLKERYNADLDRGLTAPERAQSLAFQRMLEDSLFWSAVVWPRWVEPKGWPANKRAIFGGVPPGLREVAASYARIRMRAQFRGHGIGRNSVDEIVHLGRLECDALSQFLADKPFFLGEQPTTLDASAFGLLSNVLWCPIDSPLKAHAQQRRNLVAFCGRVRERYFEKESSATA